MRRLLASAAILLLLGVVGVAPIAHAQTCDPMAANYSQCIQNATQQALQQQQQTAQNKSDGEAARRGASNGCGIGHESLGSDEMEEK